MLMTVEKRQALIEMFALILIATEPFKIINEGEFIRVTPFAQKPDSKTVCFKRCPVDANTPLVLPEAEEIFATHSLQLAELGNFDSVIDLFCQCGYLKGHIEWDGDESFWLCPPIFQEMLKKKGLAKKLKDITNF